MSDPALPSRLRPLFWEHDFSKLRWDADRDLIINRILTAGDWESIKWLMGSLGRPALRAWIEQRRGRGLDPPQLRFWELVLGLSHRKVSEWIEASDPVWAGRRRV